jgi:mevalonate kinase
MMSVSASAPGKLILLGEHAVVYGHPCIVTAVDLRIRASARMSREDQVIIRVPGLSEPFATNIEGMLRASRFPSAVRFVALAVRRLWEHIGRTFGVEIATCGQVLIHNNYGENQNLSKSEFTASYGLGSSSAVTVATIKALARIAGQDMDADSIFRLGREVVLAAQEGFSSGFDVAAATYGGTLYYVTGGKVIEPIAVNELPLVVGYTGIKADTTECIKRVASRQQRFPLLVNTIMESIAPLVNEAKVALGRGDLPEVGHLMNLNQGWLQALNVSAHELDSLIHAARCAGAYGAKLSGAGGGDCMIALVDGDSRPKVERAIEDSGIPGARVIQIRTGAEGVRIDG